MADFFNNIPKIPYEGAKSTNALAFKYYDANKIVLGKTMKEHLRFGMAWWHNLCAGGTDMFGRETADKSFGAQKGTMEHAKRKVDIGFEFMQKLGIEYYCFHDVDVIPEGATIADTNANMDEIAEYLLQKQNETGIKLLWATANLFSNPVFVNGAGSSNSAEVFAAAAAQIKKVLDVLIKLGGLGYVFWGGREGYETLLNTDMKLEQENIARLMRMSVDYARKNGFKGDFFIEPKPKEPMKHQYDFDAATAVGFIKQYGLENDFKLNIEANHATLAGHTFQHDLRVAAINNMLGSVDANQGDLLLGWDTDEFPSNIYDTTMCMYEIIKAGGLVNGGLNFDSKNRRASYTEEDMFYGYILGMDAFALGLLNAEKLINDGRIDNFIKERYSSFESGIGAKIISGQTSLEELSQYAIEKGTVQLPGSGRQENLHSILNAVLFG